MGVTLNGPAGRTVPVRGTIGSVMVVDTIVKSTCMPDGTVPHTLTAPVSSLTATPPSKAMSSEKKYV